MRVSALAPQPRDLEEHARGTVLGVQRAQRVLVLLRLLKDGGGEVGGDGVEGRVVRDGDDEDVAAAGDVDEGVARLVADGVGGDELAFGQADVALGADGDDEVLCDVWVGEAKPAFVG